VPEMQGDGTMSDKTTPATNGPKCQLIYCCRQYAAEHAGEHHPQCCFSRGCHTTCSHICSPAPTDKREDERCPTCGSRFKPDGCSDGWHSTPEPIRPSTGETWALLPCPFCGNGNPAVIPDDDEDGPFFQVYCGFCDAQGPVTYSSVEWISDTETRTDIATPDRAVKAWNEGWANRRARSASSRPSTAEQDARRRAHELLDARIDALVAMWRVPQSAAFREEFHAAVETSEKARTAVDIAVAAAARAKESHK
jgi:hypothetical protein